MADYYIRSGHFEKARDIYEEAIETVVTVRDFTQVFDAYAQFEESMVSAKMEASAESGPNDEGRELEIILNFGRLMKHLNENREFCIEIPILSDPDYTAIDSAYICRPIYMFLSSFEYKYVREISGNLEPV